MNQATQDVMFSKESDEWETPQRFFDLLNEEFKFTLDPCCTTLTAKCPKFFTLSDLPRDRDNKLVHGLRAPWRGHTAFVNPPYSKVALWLEKGRKELLDGVTSVFLLPARIDTKWFHNQILPYAREIRFVKGRLRFSGKNSAPFPSIVVVFKPMYGQTSWSNLHLSSMPRSKTDGQ